MFGQDWYWGNRTPRDRLYKAEDRVDRAESELKVAKRQLEEARAEVAAFEKFHSN